MRRVMLAVVAAAAVAVAAVVAAVPARAEEGASVTAVGWWTSIPVTSAPEGGVAVGQGATGPTAVAALRLAVDEEPPTSAVLTLTEADGVNADGAVITVCPTPNQWEPVAAGPMEDAPKPECDSGSVDLERGADGAWTGDVASLLEPNTVSLMIVPKEPAPEEPPAAPFQASFDPPATSAPAAPSSSARPSTSPTTVARPATTVAPSFTAPPAPAVTVAPRAPAPAGDPPVAIGPAVTVPTNVAALPTVARAGEPRPWGQVLFFLVVATVAGTVAGVGRNQLRARRAAV